MLTNHTGFESWPLSAIGGGDNPTLVQGSPTVFSLNTVPLYQDRLANYIPALAVTITGNVIQAGGTGSRIPWDALARILVDSLEVRNAWHGSPVSPQYIKGAMLPILEQLTAGWRPFARKRGFIPAANGTYGFSYTFPVPLSLGLGQKPHHTAQLAAFYKEAQLSLQIAPNSVLVGLSTGATLTSLAARASAILMTDPELRMGPIVEYIDYQAPATAGQVGVPVQAFGNNTMLTKTEKGAGVFFFGMLTQNFGLPGPFAPENTTRLNVPWRGQFDTGHMVPYVTQQLLAMGNCPIVGGAVDNGAAQALQDAGRFPYIPYSDPSTSQTETINLLYIPIVTPGADFEVTKCQVVDGDEQINITLSSGPSGTWHMLTGHLRSWQQSAYVDAATLLSTLGLPAKILRGGSGPLVFVPKTLRKNRSMDKKKGRFIPFVLKRQTPPADRVQLPG